MDIYGTGPDEEKLKQLVTDRGLTDYIQFHPFLKYKEMLQQYARYDWVVLPSSRKDGWGVIISEGLLNGLKGICSNICGVSWAIAEGRNGVTFDWNKEGDCRKAIEAMLSAQQFAEVPNIQKWAQKALTGEAGADYFLSIMDNVYANGEHPVAPWLANSVNP
jgi:glycosyltransferase involved in cell wall biosynthesis